MKIILRRVSTNLQSGTFGVLVVNNEPMCVTLEETWLDNIPLESCIPAGSYECRKYSGTKYKDVWEVRNVPQRSAILIHWGNTERNTSGCILVGKYFAQFGASKGVADSKATFEMLRRELPDRFNLHIEDCF
ncbi:MAG: DUF5675 family protein [Flavobacterium sp.]